MNCYFTIGIKTAKTEEEPKHVQDTTTLEKVDYEKEKEEKPAANAVVAGNAIAGKDEHEYEGSSYVELGDLNSQVDPIWNLIATGTNAPPNSAASFASSEGFGIMGSVQSESETSIIMEEADPQSDQQPPGGAEGAASAISQNLGEVVPDSIEVVQEHFDKMNIK